MFKLRSFSGTSDTPSHHLNGLSDVAMSASRGHQLSNHQHHPSVRIESQDDVSTFEGRGLARSESQDPIHKKNGGSRKDLPLEIWQDVEVRVDGAKGDERERERRKERRVLDLEIGQPQFGFQNRTTVTAFGK